MDADPTNGEKVHIGGINHWYSTDGGTTFTLTANGHGQEMLNIFMRTFMGFIFMVMKFG
jgi:hypothetical protein